LTIRRTARTKTPAAPDRGIRPRRTPSRFASRKSVRPSSGMHRLVSLGAFQAAGSGEPIRPAPLEPVENAIARSPQQRNVVGQEHKPERQHPQAEDRQDGEAPADDQKYASRNPRPAGAWLSEPTGYRLHPSRQPAEKPPEPPFRMGVSDRVGRAHGLRSQALEISSLATPRNPYFPLGRERPGAAQARSTALAAASSASTIAWICSGLAARPRRRS